VLVDTAGNTDFVDAGSSTSYNPEIQNTSLDLSAFAAGDIINVFGSTSNDGVFAVTNAATDTLQVQEAVTAETGQTCFLGVVFGGSFRELFKNGVMDIFAGSQPASADDDESGYTLLCTITRSSNTFTPGDGQNGLNFDPVSAGTLTKRSAETWSGVNDTDGTAGWFRFYDNDKTTGSSSTAIRFDGAVATSGAQLNMSSTSLTSGATTTIDSFAVTLPSS